MLGGSGLSQDLPVGGLGVPSVTIVETSHRIDFPSRIHVNLEAHVLTAVESVRLFYNIGSGSTTVYAYPDVLRNTGNLNAEFIIRTANNRFIPQGVDIEYYYVFTDSRGREIESSRFTFEYLDPRYNWQRLELDDYVLLWHDRPARAVNSVAEEVSHRLGRVKRLFGLDGDYRFKAVLVNGRWEANRSFPRVSQTSRDTSLYGGFAFGDFGALVLAGLGADGLTHELTHLMLDQAVHSPRAKIPAWLNEGLAMYFERGTASRESTVRWAVRRGGLLRLRHMGSVPGRPGDVRLFYSQSASVVRFMLDRFGEARMQSLLSDINAGRAVDDALDRSYGIGVDELDAAWRAQIHRRGSIDRIVDPGTLRMTA